MQVLTLRKKLLEFGPNEIEEVNKISPLKILLRQIKKNFVIYLLFATALISLFLGKIETSTVIFVVIAVSRLVVVRNKFPPSAFSKTLPSIGSWFLQIMGSSSINNNQRRNTIVCNIPRIDIPIIGIQWLEGIIFIII